MSRWYFYNTYTVIDDFNALLSMTMKRAVWWTTGMTWAISGGFCFLRYLTWRKKAAI